MAVVHASTTCPACGAVLPVDIAVSDPQPTAPVSGRPMVVAKVDHIDTFEYEVHLLGCPGSPSAP